RASGDALASRRFPAPKIAIVGLPATVARQNDGPQEGGYLACDRGHDHWWLLAGGIEATTASVALHFIVCKNATVQVDFGT
ncbi:hypothetical protein, partial [Allomesorhizobium camelthorni]|uniref:hypothetical protein n=1 Tax=Allomesorhizobium camelthorni TaxID=475069 RepID=UPI00197DBADD